VAIHWPGSGETDSFDSDREVADALRGWQAFHMDGRGWSDIAYQRAFSQDGDTWELRGLRTQSGANGDQSANEAYGAFLLILIEGEQPSAAMRAAVRESVLEFRKIYGNDAAEIRPHSAVRPGGGTDCPGPAARAAIARGDFEPWTNQPDPEDSHPMAELTAAEAALIGKAVADALSPRLDQIEQKYTVADNNRDAQVAAWTSVADAYAAQRIAKLAGPGGVVAPAVLTQIKDEVWQFLRPLWEGK
jgi:hypothetical protein